jgi:hypothetical protein
VERSLGLVPTPTKADHIMQARQVLPKLLEKTCSEMHKMRRTALAVNVMAALHGEVLTVTHLGRSITSRAKEKTLYQASRPLAVQSPLAGGALKYLLVAHAALYRH